jgi:hypothetical protein
MKKLVFGVLLVIAVTVSGRFMEESRSKAKLPTALLRIECQKDSLYIASEGYDSATVAGTTLVVPCVSPNTYKDLQKQWDAQDPSYRYDQSIYFRKRTDGSFEKSDIARSPIASRSPATRYTAQTTFRPHEGDHWKKPLLDDPGERWLVEIETPAAFKATGANTVFACHEYHGRSRKCGARVQSSSLYWDVFIYFASPATQESRAAIPLDLSEAYDLIAAHIVTQNPQ